MKFSSFSSITAFLVLLAGCGGGGEHATPAQGGNQDVGRQVATPMPNRETEPLKFYEWRVEQMFIKSDADGDGRLDTVEFTGPSENFQRIDSNQDGFVTQKEVLDDLIPTLKQSGEIP